MRIDVYAHYWTEKYLDPLIDLGKAGRGGAESVVCRRHELVRMTSCWVARVIAT
jgi:hypothetical protein